MTWSRHYNSAPQNGKQHRRIILNKSSVKYLELNFFTYYTVDAKRPNKLVNDVLHIFCTWSTRRNAPHFSYVPSVLGLELCMGWKCNWCFVPMNFGFIFIYVHFLKAFLYRVNKIMLTAIPIQFLLCLYQAATLQSPEGGRLIEDGL